MRFAVITPTKHLDLTKLDGNNYHMVLAHRFMNDAEYREFYLEQKKNGATVVLDNGACELKASIKGSDLYETAIKLKPDYLVIPDVLDDFENTVERSILFTKEFSSLKEHGVKFIGVVQGNTKRKWLKCFDKWFKEESIDVIGISSVKALDILDRAETIDYLIENGHFDGSKKVHILGMGDSGHIELEKLSKFTFIEGIDSSAPVVHGFSGIEIKDNVKYKKIREYIPDDMHIPETKIPLIKANIRIFLKNARS